MSRVERLSVALLGFVAYVAVVAWNVTGPGVRQLLDAESDGTLCARDAAHLALTLATATVTVGALRWGLAHSAAALPVSFGALAVLLAVGGLSLWFDSSISSSRFFAEQNRCASVAIAGPAHVLVFLVGSVGLLALEKRPRAPSPPHRPGG